MKEFKYTINYSDVDLIEVYVKQWVLEWCKKYHPEAFEKAREFVRDHLKNKKLTVSLEKDKPLLKKKKKKKRNKKN